MSDETDTSESTDTDADATSQEDAEQTTEDTEQEVDTFDADKAREKIRKINSENRNLRERASKAEAKAQENADSSEKVTALEAENLRLRVAVKHGLPENLVKRLTGTTEEELLADAEELMDLMGGKKPPTQQPKERLRGGGDPTAPTNNIDDLDKFAEQVFRN